jgi:phage terminase large subunit
LKVTEVFFKNLKAYRDGYTTIINKGGTGSSKTHSLIQLQDWISAHSKKSRKTSIVSQTNDHLRRGVITEYSKYMRREGFQRTHVPSRREYLINNSIIEYFSLGDDASRAVGPSRDILWVNEPNRGISWESYVQLSQRTDEVIFIDYNPSHKFWLQTQNVVNDPKTKVIHSTFVDNLEFLPKKRLEYILRAKELSRTDPWWDYWWKVYGLGQDGVLLEERIMPFIKWVSKVPDDAVEIPSGLDFGFFPDPTAFCRLWIKRGGVKDSLYIQQIVYDTKLSINAQGNGVVNLCDILKSKGVNPKHRIIAESADPRAVNDMRAAGFYVERVKKKSVETSIRLFHDYDIYVVEGSNDAYNELDNYRYKRDKKTNEILGIPEDGQPDHIIDLTRYILMSRGTRWEVK